MQALGEFFTQFVLVEESFHLGRDGDMAVSCTFKQGRQLVEMTNYFFSYRRFTEGCVNDPIAMEV